MAKPSLPIPVEAELLPETITEAVAKAISRPEDLPAEERKCLDCDRDYTQSDHRCIVHTQLRLPSITPAKRARGILDGNMLRYAELHLEAAERAASKGDAEPTQWALLHGGAVDPVEKKSGPTGVQVFIGMTLPGLKEESQ